MRPVATVPSLLVVAALALPVAVWAQTPPDSVVVPPPSTPAPAPAPSAPVTPLPTTPTRELPGIKSTSTENNWWFTLSGSLSMPNDSFSDNAEMGSQFLGGVHRRVWDRATLGLTFGASNWSGADIQAFHSTQITLDARYALAKLSGKWRPFVQVGFGSYQVVSEIEPDGAEKDRTSENSWGVNYGGGLLFPVGNALVGPVVLYHSAGSIPEIQPFTGTGDCKFISFGVELTMPMGR